MSNLYSDVLEALQAIEEHLNDLQRKSERKASTARDPGAIKMLQNLVFPKSEKFRPISMPDNSLALVPADQSVYVFRGQRKDWGSCKAALYRHRAREIDLFVARLRQVEFELVLRDHPAVQSVLTTPLPGDFPNGTTRHYAIRVSFPGLAQHYGIPTDYLDLTSDPYVAAFFAVCKWSDSKRRYIPITSQNKPGVLMKTQPTYYNDPTKGTIRLEPVGLQPFPRPGKQRAYAVKLSRGENFRAHKLLFQHSEEASRAIFERFDRGKELFPPDLIKDKADEIKCPPEIHEEKTYSQWAFERVMERYDFAQPPEFYLCELRERRVVITGASPYYFSDAEIDRFKKDWESSGRTEFYDQIGPGRLQYTPPST